MYCFSFVWVFQNDYLFPYFLVLCQFHLRGIFWLSYEIFLLIDELIFIWLLQAAFFPSCRYFCIRFHKLLPMLLGLDDIVDVMVVDLIITSSHRDWLAPLHYIRRASVWLGTFFARKDAVLRMERRWAIVEGSVKHWATFLDDDYVILLHRYGQVMKLLRLSSCLTWHHLFTLAGTWNHIHELIRHRTELLLHSRPLHLFIDRVEQSRRALWFVDRSF